MINITAVQMNISWHDAEKNRKKIDQLIADVSSDLIVLPEMFTTGFSMAAETIAEKMTGETIDWIKNTAHEKQAAVCGSLVICENEKFFNRLVWATPNGEVTHYDKRHLFGLAKEDEAYTSGSSKIYPVIKGFKCCPLICYDLRFPTWSRNATQYDCLIYVANWPEARRDHWRTLLKARAIENQCYVVGVNRVGTDAKGFNYVGDSALIAYDGRVEYELTNQEGLLETTWDLDLLHTYRQKFPFLQDTSD